MLDIEARFNTCTMHTWLVYISPDRSEVPIRVF